MTLLELTVVILVLMTLITLLFVAARAWKNGSDRATCIMSIRRVQQGLRSYSNMAGHSPGDTVPDLYNEVVGSGKFVENPPQCQGGGIYRFGGTSGSSVIPPEGSLYMECSLSVSRGHAPKDYGSW